jgi:Fe-Mn family superoxide dismutase
VNKRTFIKSAVFGTAGIFSLSLTSKAKGGKNKNSEFVLPALPFAYNALEPYFDAATMEIHHSKHHAAYTDKFNLAVKEAGITGKSAREIMGEVSKYPAAIRNHGGGFINHKFFWKVLTPPVGQQPSAELIAALSSNFGSLEAFKEKFTSAAKSVFGSGWAWLIADGNVLKITTTANQDSPIMDIATVKGYPLLCLDVWEHAYYLKYQNRRPEFIEAFWNVVNWDFVGQRLTQYQTNPKS